MSCATCTGTSTTPFVIKRGDLDPPIRIEVLNGLAAQSLLDADSARFILRDTRTGTLVISTTMTIENQILSPGVVSYQWQAGDTDVPGFYLAEVEIFWLSDTHTQTFPADGTINVVIARDLDTQVGDVDDFAPPGQQTFEGHGPPDANIPGSHPGDQYLDIDTGLLYELE